MARVTVEDCVDKVRNRFDLVLLSAHRARVLSSGVELKVDRSNDKNPVVALREIASGSLPSQELGEELVRSLQKQVETDESGETGVPSDSTDTPEFDPVTEDDYLKAMQAVAKDGGNSQDPLR